ncbi:MAG: prepilin-type N-terminal cleavage/methylation domain-containing protein, partial [Pyrinomonadaceae bacterium]
MQKKTSFRSVSGFSVIELLIVLVVIGIVTTLAVIALGSSASSLSRQNISREFKVALERARYDSVKRRPDTCDQMSRVEITSATSFRLLTDTNRNGSIDPASETSLHDFGSRSSTEIVGNSLVFPITIRFDGRGNSSSGPCSLPTETYHSTTFCELPCTLATANDQNATVIYVSPTGTTTELKGGESIPNFTSP